MAKSNIDRVGEALDLFVVAYRPFVLEGLNERHNDGEQAAVDILCRRAGAGKTPSRSEEWDAPAIIDLIQEEWQYLFRKKLDQGDRSMLFELRDIRNKWAHRQAFTLNDALRALDTIERLLTSIKATDQAEVVRQLHGETMRARFAEMQRAESSRASRIATEGSPMAGLRPWREVVEPHPDVASGNFTNAEFAADLAQVHRGDATTEYGEPKEFFRRTYLTEGLTGLLQNAIKRLHGKGGHPVIELQTNFGGGKTHSMLALYHLFDPKVKPGELTGVEAIMSESGVKSLPAGSKRAVIVGTKLSPGQPEVATDGTELRTLWGRVAHQLLGKEGYKLVAESDRLGTSPGSDDLVKLLRACGPCLILVDEWVAFIRETWERSDLPAGTFDANLTFVQKLTEAVKAVPTALLVASLPQSRIEVGGEGGQQALASLEDTFGRVEFNWRPASQEESYEIVRRRLFESIADQSLFAARDAVVSAYAEMYRSQRADFPSETGEMDYSRRLESAYPIHPELFDRLYNDWSTLEEFQRTRGVLRLMATVIHTLWMRGDQSLMIMPGMLPLDEQTVQSESTRYLSHTWAPIIEQDIDGPSALPLRIDKETPRFGKLSAARRVARTVYFGSAPVQGRSSKGVDIRNIRLGCVQPGENAAPFGDALRQLADSANYLYADGSRYWFDTQPNVNRTASDRANQQSPDEVHDEIRKRLRDQQKHRGAFAGVHVCPETSGDVPDDRSTRFVVMDSRCTHSKGAEDSTAFRTVSEYLEKRGSSPRLYRNALVFLVADRSALENLIDSVRMYLAWASIVEDTEQLNLNPLNARMAQKKKAESERAVEARLAEAYGWLVIPKQPDPLKPIELEFIRQQGQEGFAERASHRLERDGLLTTTWAGTLLRKTLDERLWKDRDHIKVNELADYFARYVYLDRLVSDDVLLEAIRSGLSTLHWRSDGFSYADEFDEESGRYRGLIDPPSSDIQIRIDDHAVLVKADIAVTQLDAERPAESGDTTSGDVSTDARERNRGASEGDATAAPAAYKRFYGSATLDSARVGKAAGMIAENVIAFLNAATRDGVRVTLEIEARSPEGFDDATMRTVLENCQTLKFDTREFERE